MPNVSELAAMYGNNPQNPLPTKPSQARQWPPPSNKTSCFPQSSFPTQSTVNNNNMPEWKRQLLQQRKETQNKQKEQQNNSANTTSADDNKEIQTNGQADANSIKTDTTAKENRFNKPDNSWRKQVEQKPVSSSLHKPTTSSWKTNAALGSSTVPNAFPQKSSLSQSNAQHHKSNYERTPNHTEQNNLNSNESSTSFVNKVRNSSSASSASESFRSSVSDAAKVGGNQENEFPSGGSFVSRSSQEFSSESSRLPEEEEDLPPASNLSNRPSFLHRSISNSQIGSGNDGPERQRRPIPSSLYNQPPPEKPRKPPGARLPSGSTSDSNHISSPPFSQQQPPPPLPHDRPPISPPGNMSNIPPKRGNSFLEQHRPESTSSAPAPAPALPPRNPESDKPPELPERPPHPLPNLSTGSGSGSVPPLPNRNPPSLPSRDLPPLPSSQEPPPLPPPNTRRASQIPQSPSPSVEEIPTWDDSEEETDVIYDQPPNEFGAGPPPLPSKGPAIPEETEEGEIYMPMETSEPRPSFSEASTVSKEDEKKRKEMEKKDKEMRKKFKLPLEGEIPAQSVGTIKSDLKRFGKSTVHAHEEVDVVRMSDNPKGKWLIRTKKGVYSYMDADNIELSADQLRQVMHSVSNRAPPSVPPTPAAAPIPSFDDEPLYNAAEDDEGLIYQTFS